MDVACLTLIVLILQAIIYGFMLWQMKKSTDASTVSAIAAKKSADAVTKAAERVVISERAIVLIDDVSAQPMVKPEDEYLNPSSVIVFTLKNFGDTAAHSVNLKGQIEFPNNKSTNIHNRPESTIPPQGTGKWITWSLGAIIPKEEIRSLNYDDVKVRYSIEVIYRDEFDSSRTHTYRATGQYIPVLRSFVVISSTSD